MEEVTGGGWLDKSTLFLSLPLSAPIRFSLSSSLSLSLSDASGSVKSVGEDSFLNKLSYQMPSHFMPFPLSKIKSNSTLSYRQLHSMHDIRHNNLHIWETISTCCILWNKRAILFNLSIMCGLGREKWSDLEDDKSNHISFSNTQFSISIPIATSDFSTTASKSSNNEFLASQQQ